MYGIEKAITPTATPTMPQITDVLAVDNFPGSPLAVKKKNPATINMIMAKPIKTGQMKFKILINTSQTLVIWLGNPGAVGGAAILMAGSANKLAVNAALIFLMFINL